MTSSTNKDILAKVGYQKRCCSPVNKESMNKCSSENVFLTAYRGVFRT